VTVVERCVTTTLLRLDAVDRLYRDLGLPICVFEGTWDRYQAWDGAGSRPGDGHLVSGVPAGDVERARRLLAARGAGFGLVSPNAVVTGAGDVVGAGSAGRSTTTGS
jgi:hypothetical protein